MSNPFSFPANTSPVSPVRTIEDLKNNHEYATSETRSSTITSAEVAHHIQVGPLSRSLTDITACHPNSNHSSAQSWRGNGIIADLFDTPASTPPIHPTLLGSHELRFLPQDVSTGLDSPKPLSPPGTTLSVSLDRTLSSPTITTIKTSFTGTHQILTNIVQRNGLSIRGKSSDSVKDYKGGAFSSAGQPSLDQRTIPQGIPNCAAMSEFGDLEVGNNNNGMKDRGSLSEARRVTFSGETRNRSSSRTGNGRVEKKIEATLPNVEQPSNARSRKSSHVLGLFKENTASQESKKGQDKSRPELSALQGDDNMITSGHEDSASIQKVHGRDEPMTTKTFNPREPDLDKEKGPLQYPISSEDLQTLSTGAETSNDIEHTPSQLLSGKENLVLAAGNTREDSSFLQVNESDSAIIKTLSEEFGKYPHTTTSFHDKLGLDKNTSNNSLNLKNTPVLSQRARSTADGLDDSKEISLADRNGEAEEDEDSDKEQISSALYYPHQAPSPDPLEDLNFNVTGQLEGSTDTESSRLGARFFDEQNNENQSEDVDIALQSQNKSRYLHGDLQKTWVPSAKNVEIAAESGASSTSDTEYESLDENVLSEAGEDSSLTDELQTTPTATPSVKDSFVALRGRKPHRPRAAPLGAVELKPYNHQVGGHTKVFQFSKQAVCKQLSNRENVFYEVVEREHPDLLKFLPRYVMQSLYLVSIVIYVSTLSANKATSSTTATPSI